MPLDNESVLFLVLKMAFGGVEGGEEMGKAENNLLSIYYAIGTKIKHHALCLN